MVAEDALVDPGGWVDPSQLTNGRASLVPSADLLVLQSADVRKVLAGC